MCGIIGSINIEWNNNPIDTISQRGPDFQNHISFDNLFLGHSRLSILDVSKRGNQPMISENENWIIIYNGEVYNHLEIRDELINKFNEKFISNSDTETILKGWIHYGDSLLPKLNGIFSFAIYDRSKSKLTLVRDPHGVKPMYIYQDEEKFAFSSELKSFTKIKNFKNDLNLKGLVAYLSFLWSPGKDTMYSNVKKLLPGNLMEINIKNNKTKVREYKKLKFKEYKNLNTEEDYINKLDELLNKAVKRQLLSDVPLGFFLSGGLDSSLLVAIAKKHYPNKKLNCFTINTKTSAGKEGFQDDLPYARKVANYLNVQLHEVEISNNLDKNFDEMIYCLDEPQADLAPNNVRLISQLANKMNIKVLIGGAAGDDLFSGYRRHKAIKFEKNLDKIPNKMREVIKFIFLLFPSKLPIFRRLKKITRDWNDSQQNRLFGYFNWLPYNNFLEKILIPKISDFDVYEYFKIIMKNVSDKSLLSKMLYLEQKTFLIDHNLNYTDKMSMIEGIEARVPYLDLELVEFSKQIPDNLKIKNGTTKYILKKVAERYLPKHIIYRSKTGFGAPVRDMIDNELQSLIDKYLNKERIIDQNIFNYNKIKSMIESHNRGHDDFGYNILSLLAIQSWLDQFSWKKIK